MATIIEIDGMGKAILGENGRWRSSNAQLTRTLNNATNPEEYGTEIPDKELAIAQDMVKMFHGSILEYNEYKYVKGRVY